ncbi:MAG: hypothetical protein AAF366_11340, partial [Pseudomonadota bacterium]
GAGLAFLQDADDLLFCETLPLHGSSSFSHSKVENSSSQWPGYRGEGQDASTSITYDQEEGRIYINGKEVRPSELLFIFDRNSYSEELKKFRLTEVVAEPEEEARAT